MISSVIIFVIEMSYVSTYHAQFYVYLNEMNITDQLMLINGINSLKNNETISIGTVEGKIHNKSFEILYKNETGTKSQEIHHQALVINLGFLDEITFKSGKIITDIGKIEYLKSNSWKIIG